MSDAKKIYSKDELLRCLFKHGNIPVILFAKDEEAKYVYASEDTDVVDWIDGGDEKSVLGKTDLQVQCDKELGKLYYDEDKEIVETGNPTHTYSEIDEKGKKFVLEIKKNPIYVDGKLIGISGIVNDVTELMELKKRFETLSYIDTVTQCYNRNYFLKHDYDEVKYLPCTYIMCDCNNLKKVNDKYGHKEGDKYIQNTVQILKSVLPADGICVRWGGDEFLLIIPYCTREKCRQIIQEINEKQKAGRKKDTYIDIAAGACVREDIRLTEEDVIKMADRAMYQDKKRRKEDNLWK